MAPSLEDDASLPLTQNVERVLLENRSRFVAFLERRLGSRGAAEDLLQGAFLKALESKAAPADAEGAVRWFFRVLRNALLDEHRRRGAEERASERLAREPAVEDPELHDAVCACLRGLLPALKPEYAEVLRQVDLDERPVGEVAGLLGVSSNNASVRLHRARQALKRQLERSCGACATHGCLDCTCKG